MTSSIQPDPNLGPAQNRPGLNPGALWSHAKAWRRDSDRPCMTADDPDQVAGTRHVFAPCVAFENGSYRMWFCGSSGSVEQRVFTLRLATSRDGIHFQKQGSQPIFSLPDGQHSILTPTLLRNPDGSLCRENGRLRMWFASCNFPAADSRHTLHDTTSADGIHWSAASPPLLEAVYAPLLEAVYAPTIIKEDNQYLMWYSDVSMSPWTVRHARSADGCSWRVDPRVALTVDQPWEYARLFYPTVLKINGWYHLWYGAYSHKPGCAETTAIGLAVSADGFQWRKHPDNPVFSPDPAHAWESHYTTSQTILRISDGAYRIWYASRPKPPFDQKYFAIGTALWRQP